MKEYPKIKFGRYKGWMIDQIPLEYLMWLFPKLKFKRKDRELYLLILQLFLSKNIRVEDKNGYANGYCFYFNDYEKQYPDGKPIPFMQSFWRMTNSKGEYVYELNHQKNFIYIQERDGVWNIETNYVSHRYIYGGLTMVYEKNPDYYFYDGYGRIVKGAFLMRKPWIPDGSLAGDFSENLPIENLSKRSKYQIL